MKTQDAVEVFHLLENSHKFCRGFQQAMEARRTSFISFIKNIFRVNKDKSEALTFFFYQNHNKHRPIKSIKFTAGTAASFLHLMTSVISLI